MQGQKQSNQIQVGFIVEEYQEMVAELQNQLVMARAYVKQLEAQLAENNKANGEKKEGFPEQTVIPNSEIESK
jgi:uncharacterized protein YgiM (DUF1202 family)